MAAGDHPRNPTLMPIVGAKPLRPSHTLSALSLEREEEEGERDGHDGLGDFLRTSARRNDGDFPSSSPNSC